MKRILYLIILLLLQLNVFGQKVEVKSFVDKNNVSTSEVITFTISTNSSCQIYTPDFGGLQVIQGPFQSSSTRIVNINGKRTAERELSFTYRVKAPSAGTFKIDGIKLICGGQEYQTKSIKITASKSQNNGGQNVTIPKKNAEFFMRMYASKTKVYQGEPFSLTLKIFSRNQPQNIENLEIGDSKGLIRKDLNPKKSTFNSNLEIINGIKYLTTTIRSELCFAQNSGKIEINPAYVSAIFSRGIFSQYRLEANSNKLTINVSPLPSGAPKNFNGLVGSFKLTNSISKRSLKPGEAIDLKLKISGTGNLNTFDKPNLSFPRDFEQFDPEVKDRLSYKSSGISGSIEYDYVLIPTFHGEYTIPAYTFSYFDLESEKYKSLSTGDFEIEVQKTANSEAGSNTLTSNKKAVEVIETDIHHLLSYDNNSFIAEDFLIKKVWYYGLLICPALLAWFFLWKRKQKQSDSYLDSTAIKSSLENSKKTLTKAKTLASEKKNNEAIKEISMALKSFIKEKNSLSNIDLSRHQIIDFYENKNWPEKDITTLKNVWDQIDMYQYAPITADKLDDLILETENLIDKIDQSE